MLKWDELKTAELGHPFEIKALKSCCKAIYGGVSWPGKRPGGAVVVAIDRSGQRDSGSVCLLDECESPDMWALIRQCGVMDFKYRATVWVGNQANSAAAYFIQQINDERQTAEQAEGWRCHRTFSLTRTPILDMEHPYEYILPVLKQLLSEDYRQLFLKDSRIVNYMAQIEPDEIASMEFGEFPAIEALAFAVIAMRRAAKAEYEDQFYQPVDDDYNRLSLEGLGL